MKASAACAHLRLSLRLYPPAFGLTPSRRPSAAVSPASRRGGGRGRGCCARAGGGSAGRRAAPGGGPWEAAGGAASGSARLWETGGAGMGGAALGLGPCGWAQLGAASPRRDVRAKRFGRTPSFK